MNAIGPLIRFLQLPKEFAGSHGLSAFPPRPAGSSNGAEYVGGPMYGPFVVFDTWWYFVFGKIEDMYKAPVFQK